LSILISRSDSCAEIRYKGGFVPALLVYTPTLPLPLETRGRGPSLTRMSSTFALSYL